MSYPSGGVDLWPRPVAPGRGFCLWWATPAATPDDWGRPSLGGRVAAREVWSGGGSLPLDTAALARPRLVGARAGDLGGVAVERELGAVHAARAPRVAPLVVVADLPAVGGSDQFASQGAADEGSKALRGDQAAHPLAERVGVDVAGVLDGNGAQGLDVQVPLVVGGAGGGALGDELEEVGLAGVGPGGQAAHADFALALAQARQ